MKLIIVRHGETEENKRKVFQGQSHGKLSREGREQARKLAKRLANEEFDVIISSDLRRASDTTKIIATYHKKIPIIYSKLLRERAMGDIEGRKHADFPSFKSGRDANIHRKAKGGESFIDLRKRAIAFFKEAIEKYHGKTVLMVSHGAFNRVFLGYLMKRSIKDSLLIKQGNTAVNIIEIGESGKHRVHLIGDVKHL